MATTAEKKALFFAAAVALLGGATRIWRSTVSPPPEPHPTAPTFKSSLTRTASSKTSHPAQPQPDDNTTLNLDSATLHDLTTLGIKPGHARMIIEDRDKHGPFGSIQSLKRVPYLPHHVITKLAPHVTFSHSAIPANAVIYAPAPVTLQPTQTRGTVRPKPNPSPTKRSPPKSSSPRRPS